MILSNLNRDHGLLLPQLSDLGLTESLFPGDINIMPLENAFYSYRSTEFNTAYDKLVKQILLQVSLTPNQLEIVKAQGNRIKKTAAIYFDSCNKQVDRTDLPDSDLYNQFNLDGCVGFKINPDEMYKLIVACNSDIQKLRGQPDRRTSPTKFDAYDRMKVLDQNHQAFVLVDKLFKMHGVFDAVSKYNQTKANLKLDTVALHVARPNDSHHYQTLNDVPGNPKTISFHMDPKFNVMKAIVYLNEVTETNGPFTTVPKSNRWYHPEFERIIACGNSVGNYLSSPDHRKAMSIFPDVMTKNVIMGRYFEDGSDNSNILLNNMHKYTSEEADCILFDPAQTIHRGGLCDEGERVNLQIIMR
jgi:hypothetical protein